MAEMRKFFAVWQPALRAQAIAHAQHQKNR